MLPQEREHLLPAIQRLFDAVPKLYHATMVTLRSPASPIWRMLIIDSDQVNTPAITIATAPSGIESASTCQGRSITSTPTRPTTTAVARRGPTRSPSNGTDTMVRNSGMAKPSAVTVTSGSTPNP